jgi:SNF2 family DNA or RNA helicase
LKMPSHGLVDLISVIPTEISVFPDHHSSTVIVYLHEEGKNGTYFFKMVVAMKKDWMVQEIFEKKRVQREIFCPPDAEEMVWEVNRKIKQFATRYGSSNDKIHFYRSAHEKRRQIPQLVLPRPWLDPKNIQTIQNRYRDKLEEEKMIHARQLCNEGERLLLKDRHRAALRCFRDAVQVAPNFFLPVLRIGKRLMQEEKWEDAKKNLEQARSLFEKNQKLSKDKRHKIALEIEEAFSRCASRHQNTQVSVPPPAPSSSSMVSKEPSKGSSHLPASVPVSFTISTVPLALRYRYQARSFEGRDIHALRLEAEQLKFLESFDELLAPQQARIEPYDHQIRTIRIALLRMRGRALLADEVGLGKTIEAGLALKEYVMREMVSKVLILVVPSLVSQWQEEMEEKFDLAFATTEKIHQFKSPDVFWTAHSRVIASLALAKREPHQSAILQQEYDLVIVDEAHHLRNRETIAWRFVSQLKKKYFFLLTATPIQNDLEELYNLVTLLHPGQLGTALQFRRKFIERKNARKAKNTEALRSLLRNVMIRNTRVSAKVPLPRRFARTISIEFNEEERMLYRIISQWVRELHGNKAVNRMMLSLLQRQAGSSFQAVFLTLHKLQSRVPSKWQGQLGEIRQIMKCLKENSKALALNRVLEHTKEKCLIFTEFLGTQAYLAEWLRKKGHNPILFHGSLSSTEKSEAIRKFQDEGRILLSTPSGGEGTNLQFCRTVVNFDLPWNPMKIEQRIGRVHRIGQTGETLIYNFAAKETIEHYLLKILDEKLNLFELVVGEAETILGELTEEKDFEEILMDIWLEAADANQLESKIDHLGNQILEEKERYLGIKKYDETFFGDDYETI